MREARGPIVVLVLVACLLILGPSTNSAQEATWSAGQKDRILEIAYGSESHLTQYGALLHRFDSNQVLCPRCSTSAGLLHRLGGQA